MKFMPVVVVALLMLVSVPVHASSVSENNVTDNVTVLISLPTGAVFWGHGKTINSTTVDILKTNHLDYSIINGTLYVEGFAMSRYHFDGTWQPGFYGTVVAWSDGVPGAYPDFRYPGTNSGYHYGGYVPGAHTVWQINMTGVSSVLGFKNEIILTNPEGLTAYGVSGLRLWSVALESPLASLIYNDTLFAVTSNGTFVAVSPRGVVLNRLNLNVTNVSAAYLAGANGRVYVQVHSGNSANSELYGYSAGALRWNVTLNGTASALTVFHGDVVSVDEFNGTWTLYVLKNTNLLWKHTFTQTVYAPASANFLYVQSSDGTLYNFTVNGTYSTVRVGASTGSAAPVVRGEQVFVATDSGIFRVQGNTTKLMLNTTAQSFWVMPEHVAILNGSGIFVYTYSGALIWHRSDAGVLGFAVIDRYMIFYDSGSVTCVDDETAPVIAYTGKTQYRYGDTVTLHINMTDNVGVREGTVKYAGYTVHGTDLNISFYANFSGTEDIYVVAKDYSGNTAYKTIVITVYLRDFVVHVDAHELYAGVRKNITISVKDDKLALVDDAFVRVYLDGKLVSEGDTINGYYTAVLNLTAGPHNLTVSVQKEGFVSKNVTYHIFVKRHEAQSAGGFLIIYGVVFILISVIVLLAFVLRRKWLKGKELEHEKFRNKNEG